jgi:hypothetical protein
VACSSKRLYLTLARFISLIDADELAIIPDILRVCVPLACLLPQLQFL